MRKIAAKCIESSDLTSASVLLSFLLIFAHCRPPQVRASFKVKIGMDFVVIGAWEWNGELSVKINLVLEGDRW